MSAILNRDDHLTDRELAAFLRAIRERHHCHRRRDHALFGILASTGKRPREVIELKFEDLHLEDHEPWIRFRLLKARREHGRIQDLPISRSLVRTVRAYVVTAGVGAGDRVFPMTVRNAELLFHHYAGRAGLRPDLRLYCLRHTTLDRAHRISHDLPLVQSIAGHASSSTTTRYIRPDPAEVRRVIERIAAV